MKRTHRALAVGAAVISVLAAEIDAQTDHIGAVELAGRIMNGDPQLRVLDLRSRAAFDEFHIPTAQLSSINALTQAPLPPNVTTVLYSDGGAHAAQAWVLLRMRGFKNVFFLRDGIYEWNAQVMQPLHASPVSRFFGGTPVADVSQRSSRRKRGC